MACRKDESVPVEPFRIARIVLQVLCPDGVGHRCSAEGQSRVSAVRSLNAVNGEAANSVDAQRFEGFGDFAHTMMLPQVDCFLRTQALHANV